MGTGIPRSHSKIYPVAPVSSILCFKCIMEFEKESVSTHKLRVSNGCLQTMWLLAHEFTLMARMSCLLFGMEAVATFRLAHLFLKKVMAQLHLLFSLTSRRYGLRNYLDNRLGPRVGRVVAVLASFQRDTLMINQVFRFDKWEIRDPA